MNWFSGSIPEAIGLAKSTNAIFVVYIHDSSEASKTTDETLAQKEFASGLSSEKFVAIKLEKGTEPANQFSQIYPVVLLPSLYFISGSTGIPLEILGGAVGGEKLKEKLDQLTNGPGGTAGKPQEEPSVSAPEEMVVDQPTESMILPSTSKAEVETPDVPQDSTPSVPEGASPAVPEVATSDVSEYGTPVVADSFQDSELSENTVERMEDDAEHTSEVTLEERVERAKVLLAEKQAKKAEESAEDDKKKEMERRKMGQEVAKRKRQMQDEEIQSMVRERKKEKEEERAARERIRAQIAADRLEAQARATLFKDEPSAPAQEPSGNAGAAAASTSNRNCTITRIKFRLLDGSSSVAEFPVGATLADVRRHVQQQLVSLSGFSLMSSMHQHPFTPQDNDITLSNLGLVPSAILIVSNSSGSGGGSLVPSQGGIMQFLWLILSPITFILGFVRQLFSSISGNRSNSSTDNSSSAGSSQTSSQQRPSSSFGRREGNIYRLHNSNDDDENNTWNGNSTQQM